MQLYEIIHNIKTYEIRGNANPEISGVFFDSRKVTPQSLYIAVKGISTDGHDFIDQAVEKGAAAVICENFPASVSPNVIYISVEDSAKTLGLAAGNFYKNPSQKLFLTGITGTNGKTSVTTILYDLFTNLGYKCALISTVENRIADKVYPSTHTTPDILTINKILHDAVQSGCEYAFIEVSSHGIHQRRIDGLSFRVAGFTNITHDHLDYHGTFREYINTKKKFFDELSAGAVAITNADDRNGSVMLQNTPAKKKTFALKTAADYHGKIREADINGMLLNFNGKEFCTSFTGKFNAYNLLLAFAVAREAGLGEATILQTISSLHRVKGRFETIKSPSGIFLIVDYAHTPDALENILDSVNEIRTTNERLITVFGCGGDRDHAKRPEMGRIAARKSTVAIITSDNPRTENPLQIIKEIEEGIEAQDFKKYLSIPDRKEAIKSAIKFAEPKDIILVAGKGHEDYQEVDGVKYHFDDKEVIAELLTIMGK